MLREYQLCFAFGANLSVKQMRDRYPSVIVAGMAYYPNHTLAFTRKSKVKNRKGGWSADMVFSPGKRVWGVLYYLTTPDLLLLDKQETTHLDDGYLRQKIVVFGPDNEERCAWAYFVKVKKGNGLPHPLYMEKILKGAKGHRLPPSYIAHLNSIKVLSL